MENINTSTLKASSHHSFDVDLAQKYGFADKALWYVFSSEDRFLDLGILKEKTGGTMVIPKPHPYEN